MKKGDGFTMREDRNNEPEKSPSDLQKLRWGIGADILKMMDRAEEPDLPLPNVHRLTQVMQEYYTEGDFAEVLPPKAKWKPTAKYWQIHLSDIRAILRKGGKYFEFLRNPGEFKGVWKFVNKKEFETIMAREYQGVSTSADTYNDRLYGSKWQHDKLMPIASIPRLTN